MELDIAALRLTDEESKSAAGFHSNPKLYHRAAAEAQLAKALYGIVIWLEAGAPHDRWAASGELERMLREAGIKEPSTAAPRAPR